MFAAIEACRATRRHPFVSVLLRWKAWMAGNKVKRTEPPFKNCPLPSDVLHARAKGRMASSIRSLNAPTQLSVRSTRQLASPARQGGMAQPHRRRQMESSVHCFAHRPPLPTTPATASLAPNRPFTTATPSQAPCRYSLCALIRLDYLSHGRHCQELSTLACTWARAASGVGDHGRTRLRLQPRRQDARSLLFHAACATWTWPFSCR